ncbi:rhomboid family intramembrane serine protease [Alicyclobacillus fastidiosus]|uniref:Rhomboid family intramembrane serine protease n=1 Tax=Alicyclobacillus fastidiosus TaxID=392011 RepID=A0ABV5A9F2_9BACL|nr:rhomboid family intramembrane serine protease [Alicyclobacillus fastidiosus]WEH10833.1 rhomboid family intramembrane serine protease [Alicyclobacillus fastidiosus]
MFPRSLTSIAGWPATWKIILITVAWYAVVQTVFGHSTAGDARAGAMVGIFVAHGQVFRLLTATFVHVSVAHLLVNMISLWTLTAVESLLGTNVFLTIYFVSGLFGNVLTLAFIPDNDVSAGASGAIFGLFGAMLALSLLRILPAAVRTQLLFILAINVVLDFTNHDINWLAHLGGMIAGMLITLIYVKTSQRPSVWRIAAGGMSVLTAISLVAALFVPLPGI